MGLFILSAVSGTGKSTIAGALVDRGDRWRVSTSHTTRKPRGNEVDGIQYHFRSHEAFETMIKRDEFVEWASYVGQYYGTSIANVDGALADGADLLFDIEINGARQIKQVYPHAHSIFILPPSFEILKTRLLGRATDKIDKIYRRLERGLDELRQAEDFDYLIVNEDLEQSLSAIETIRDGRTESLPCQRALLEEVRADMAAFLAANASLETAS